MREQQESRIKRFEFRHLHPRVAVGTASDRYAGWIGQIYSRQRYAGQITRRTKRVGGRSFVEEVLPVRSVEEFFLHFDVLEVDFTFYRSLLDKAGKPTQNYHVLRTYSEHLNKEDRLILKVPQVVFAKKIRRGGGFVDNEGYLDPGIFIRRFYDPAIGLMAPWITGFVFEQEYQRKKERSSPKAFAQELDRFFAGIPKDPRYHVEIRTDGLLAPPVFETLERHGVGLVLSHWTWLPPLSRQFDLSGRKFLNSARQCIVRLMTPRGLRYEEAYGRAHPFNALVDGMMDPRMVDETVNLMNETVKQLANIHVIINNRAGGNAPQIAQQIMRQFLQGQGE
jgi:uncharacterized protein YecE (DUF72 family)